MQSKKMRCRAESQTSDNASFRLSAGNYSKLMAPSVLGLSEPRHTAGAFREVEVEIRQVLAIRDRVRRAGWFN